jgi:riboflavin synthase
MSPVFTGLIESTGRIVRAVDRSLPEGLARDLTIAPDSFAAGELALGDSVAIDGCCLTVTENEARHFVVQAGPETLARTTVGAFGEGTVVNLERAVLPTTRLGGHIVAGHVDGVGKIESRVEDGPWLVMRFQTPAAVLRYVVEKGSIAVDGISLTVNQVDGYAFAVALIPHTLDRTGLGRKPPGSRVNLEVDIVGKYVEKFVVELAKERQGR